MEKETAFVCLLLVFTLMSGCLSGSDPEETEPDPPIDSSTNDENASKEYPDPVNFQWSPEEDETEFIYILEITAGPDTECIYELDHEGTSPSAESDLLSFYMAYNTTISTPWARAFITWEETSLHYHPIHTSPLQQNLSHMTGIGSGWGGSGGGSVSNETVGIFHSVSGASQNDGPTIDVDCDNENAMVQFYLATEYERIISSTADGGFGYNANLLQISSNEEDWCEITTTADFVLLDISQWAEDSTQWDPFAEGRLLIESPSNNETVEFDLGTDELWNLQHVWNKPGQYRLEFDRTAQAYSPLMGVLAAFTLDDQVGSLNDEG